MMWVVLLLSLLFLYFSKSRPVLFWFNVFNCISILTFWLQYSFNVFDRFNGISLLPGQVEIDNLKLLWYCIGITLINYSASINSNINIYKQKWEWSNLIVLILSLPLTLPILYFGEDKGFFWTTSLLLVPIVACYKLFYTSKSIFFNVIIVTAAFLLLLLKSSKGVFVNFSCGIIVILLLKKNKLSSYFFIFILTICSGVFLLWGINKQLGSDHNLLYIFEREYSFEVYLKVEETNFYFKYIIGEILDIIPSSILSMYGIPKLGNSRVLFADFKLDYSGDIGYYIGSMTYIALNPFYYGKIFYSLVLGFILNVLSRISAKPEILGIVIFNMDFLFNGNFSYFFVECIVPIIFYKIILFIVNLFKRLYVSS
jgi:hypothetical protein